LTRLNRFKFPSSTIFETKAKNIPPLPTVPELVKLYQVKATKNLSQNFLYDHKILNRFVANMKRGNLDDQYVCEVGPGPGSISRSIIQRNPKQLVVIEKDYRFLPMLKYLSSVSDEKLQIVHGDILKFDLQRAFPEKLSQKWNDELPPFHICGNLPFNISLPLLFRLLGDISEQKNVFELGRIPLTFTFQHEVGERLVANPGDKQRCRISVGTQFYCDVEYCFTISGGSFVPAPKVNVAVMKLIPKIKPSIDLPFKKVDHVIKHIMHNRNRPCIHGVKSLFPPRRTDLFERFLKLTSLDTTKAASTFENDHFRDLCLAFEEIAVEIPQLRLVDTYSAKPWLKYFDEKGEPLEDALVR